MAIGVYSSVWDVLLARRHALHWGTAVRSLMAACDTVEQASEGSAPAGVITCSDRFRFRAAGEQQTVRWPCLSATVLQATDTQTALTEGPRRFPSRYVELIIITAAHLFPGEEETNVMGTDTTPPGRYKVMSGTRLFFFFFLTKSLQHGTFLSANHGRPLDRILRRGRGSWPVYGQYSGTCSSRNGANYVLLTTTVQGGRGPRSAAPETAERASETSEGELIYGNTESCCLLLGH
jgi:hypothetical protein